MKSELNLRYFKLFSIEANILPISAEHNDFYTISIDTNNENDIFAFIPSVVNELKNSNSHEEISSAYIIANYYSIFKRIHTKLIAEITYSKQNIIIEFKETFT